MCTITLKNCFKDDSGFTLLEIAISLVLVGLVIAALVPIYQQQRIQKNEDMLNQRMADVQSAIGGFRAVYGRYPRPMQTTATPGDLEYGHEIDAALSAAIPVNSCQDGVCKFASVIPGENILIGTMPFKKLELQEDEVYDRNLNRFTYAVTESLTDSATFTLTGGGISIVDTVQAKIPPAPPVPLVDPPNTAHFILVTHGPNKAGGISRDGAIGVGCASGSLDEQENCDGDNVFVSAEYSAEDFDDRVGFFSAVFPSEWQKAEADESVIHMKSMDSIAIGANATENLNDEEQLTIRNVSSGDAAVLANNNFHSDVLCERDPSNAGDCFRTSLIAGQLAGTTGLLEADRTNPARPLGISCYDSANPATAGDFLVGIQNGVAQCANEIYQTCPLGQFVESVASGVISCSGLADPACPSENVTNFCGVTKTLAPTPSGESGFVFGGECRNIRNVSGATFRADLEGLTFAEKQAYIDALNAEPRTIEDCGATPSRALVRDNYECDAGTWDYISTYEKRRYHWPLSASWTKHTLTWGGPWPAENHDVSDDPNNTSDGHDCWCREDYRIIEDDNCPEFFTGTSYRVQKHRCPQTRQHRWWNVASDVSACTCSPQTITETQSCNSYYNEVNGVSNTTGLSGQVTLNYEITCVDGEPVRSEDPTSVNTSQCSCDARADDITRLACGEGLTNSWSWAGGSETNVDSIVISEWICPPTTSGGLPDPGFYADDVTIDGPECTCDGSAVDIVVEECPNGLEGAGRQYERDWVCDAGHPSGGYWEPNRDNWTLLSDSCFTCSWSTPSGAPSVEGTAFGERVGDSCSCGEAPAAFCHEFSTTSNFNVWTGCQCVVNPE